MTRSSGAITGLQDEYMVELRHQRQATLTRRMITLICAMIVGLQAGTTVRATSVPNGDAAAGDGDESS